MSDHCYKLGCNVKITARDVSGEKIYEREQHNIFLDGGRTWFSLFLGYDTQNYVVGAAPPEAEPAAAAAPAFTRNVTAGLGSPTAADLWMPYRPFYVAYGIGGNQQDVSLIPAAVATDYPGTNLQTDTDVTVTGLERPVRIRVAAGGAPAWARWLAPVIVTLPVAKPYSWIKYTSTLTVTDVNDAGIPSAANYYPEVPISEAAIYRWTPSPDETVTSYAVAADLPFTSSSALAYTTFSRIPKSRLMSITTEWSFLWS